MALPTLTGTMDTLMVTKIGSFLLRVGVDVNRSGNKYKGILFMGALSAGELNIGMRVRLTDPDPYYDIGRNNPKVGSGWECDGEVEDIHEEGIDVIWDNGSRNTYKDYELSATYSGRCKSIW